MPGPQTNLGPIPLSLIGAVATTERLYREDRRCLPSLGPTTESDGEKRNGKPPLEEVPGPSEGNCKDSLVSIVKLCGRRPALRENAGLSIRVYAEASLAFRPACPIKCFNASDLRASCTLPESVAGGNQRSALGLYAKPRLANAASKVCPIPSWTGPA